MTTPHDEASEAGKPRDVRDSQHDTGGDMGVSSERVGHTGPGQQGTTGIRDTSEDERDPEADVPPEQTPGQVEPNPEGLEPKAGYSSVDPRSPE
jgi:hypothetical protein